MTFAEQRDFEAEVARYVFRRRIVKNCMLHGTHCVSERPEYDTVDAMIRASNGYYTYDQAVARLKEGHEPVPPFTRDMNSTWRVVEHMQRQHRCALALRALVPLSDPSWSASFTNSALMWVSREARTPQLAICKAAVDTMRYLEGQKEVP